MKNYYERLGVNKDSKDEEIKRAFRDLVKKYHPDVNKDPSASEKFKEIYLAYEILRDPIKRAEYDLILERYSQNESNINEDLFQNINLWVSQAQSNFEKYIGLDISCFLKVSLGKITYSGLRLIRFTASVLLFIFSLLFAILTFSSALNLYVHFLNNSLSFVNFIGFLIIASLHTGIILLTRKFVINYQNNYSPYV